MPAAEMHSEVSISGKRSFNGELSVPGDKSISHRALLISALSSGTSTVKGLSTGMSLGRAIRYAIERKNMLSQLERSLQEIKQLKETHPDCANCKLVGTHRAPGKK